jgi:hypothetical protein
MPSDMRDENFARAQEREQAARHGQVFGQRLEKHAQSARHMKRAGEMAEKTYGDNVPAVEEFWFLG